MADSVQLPIEFPFDRFEREPPIKRALLLDYDGTLAAFHADRMQARPSPLMSTLLRQLSLVPNSRTAIVSGRPVQELLELLGDELMIEMWGAHGWERWTPGGPLVSWDPPQSNVAVFAEAAALAQPLLSAQHVEIKAGSVAVHTRALPEAKRRDIARRVPAMWEPLARHHRLHVLRFDGGVELRDATRTKATVVRELCDELGTDSLVAYLGDDVTDEDAFGQLTETDWSVLVSERRRSSHARFWLTPGSDVARFLAAWIGWNRRVDESS